MTITTVALLYTILALGLTIASTFCHKDLRKQMRITITLIIVLIIKLILNVIELIRCWGMVDLLNVIFAIIWLTFTSLTFKLYYERMKIQEEKETMEE